MDRRKALAGLAQLQSVRLGAAICNMRGLENLSELQLLTDLLDQANDIRGRIATASDQELLKFGQLIGESADHIEEILGNHEGETKTMLERFANKALRVPENKQRDLGTLRKRKTELIEEESRLEKKLRDARAKSEFAIGEKDHAETGFAAGEIDFAVVKSARVSAAEAVRGVVAADEELRDHLVLVRRASEMLAEVEEREAASAQIELGERLRAVLGREVDALVEVMRVQAEKESILDEIRERCPKLDIGFAWCATPEFSVRKRGRFVLWLRDLASKVPGVVRGEAAQIVRNAANEEQREVERRQQRIAEANTRAESARRAYQRAQYGSVSVEAERQFEQRFAFGPSQRI